MKSWQILVRGMAMGAADMVPGISGGTIAFITGIYTRLIHSLSQLGPELLFTAKRQGIHAAWQRLDGHFLFTLLAGILISVLLLANLISWLLLHYPMHLQGFFLGMVAGSALLIARQISDWQLTRLLALGGGMLLASAVTHFLPSLHELSLISFFIGGAIAICAMILPGISGSFLLLIMGLYAPVLEAVRSFQLNYLAALALGCGFGLLFFSRLLRWLLDQHRQLTFAVLLGFVIASMRHLWPWQLLKRYRLSEDMQVIPLETHLLLPWHYVDIFPGAHHWLSIVFLFLLGWFLVLRMAPKHL